MRLGLASAVLLAIGGGAAVLFEPGLAQGRLTAAGRRVFAGVGPAMLDGSLPTGGPARQRAIDGLLQRIDELVAGLPPHAQAELSQLLALMAAAPGRRSLVGLDEEWGAAWVPKVQAALQSMRTSALSLRQQAYHALHDITVSAYFSDASTWGLLGYPGPVSV